MAHSKFRKAQNYVNSLFEKECVRRFKSRGEVFEYLEKDVFDTDQFQAHVSETAKTSGVNYLLAYELITNYLTDVLYEIDIAATSTTRKKKISMYSYFFLDIGFMVSTNNKKMFLEKLIIKN